VANAEGFDVRFIPEFKEEPVVTAAETEAGNLTIPATLHKYLYTGGDPVNFIDPLGQDAEVEDAELTKLIALTLVTGAVMVPSSYEVRFDRRKFSREE